MYYSLKIRALDAFIFFCNFKIKFIFELLQVIELHYIMVSIRRNRWKWAYEKEN